MFLVLDMEDQDFARPMLAVYGLDTNKPAVSNQAFQVVMAEMRIVLK